MVADSLNQSMSHQCSACGHWCSLPTQKISASESIPCPNCQSPLILPEVSAQSLPERGRASAASSRPLPPTGRLKPATFVPAPPSLPQLAPKIEPPTGEIQPTHASNSETTPLPTAAPAELNSQTHAPASDSESAPEISPGVESESETESGSAAEVRDRSESSRSRRRRSSSSRRPAGELSWNEIGVDGLPIKRNKTLEPAADEEVSTEGTRLRDVTGLLLAFGLSLLLTQLGLWWVAGIDPLGFGPTVAGWFPQAVPQTLTP